MLAESLGDKSVKKMVFWWSSDLNRYVDHLLTKLRKPACLSLDVRTFAFILMEFFFPADIVSTNQLIGERNKLKFYLWNNQ